jgi:4-hydroxythreonine-4-phosphate dehydrogenase
MNIHLVYTANALALSGPVNPAKGDRGRIAGYSRRQDSMGGKTAFTGGRSMKPTLGILLGEATGIGPEIVAKLCARNTFTHYCRPVLIGDTRVLEIGKKIAGVDFPIRVIKNVSEVQSDRPMPILDQRNLNLRKTRLGKIDPTSGRATGETLITALKLCQSGAIDGFVFAPLNKAALRHGGYDFKDEHRLFAHYLKWPAPYGEMNVVGTLWTSRVTSHIPLKEVASHLNIENVLTAIRLAHATLIRAGFAQPRIAVAALNPHSGDQGLCGREEIDIIGPAVQRAQVGGINAVGPLPADTIFVQAFRGSYDAVTSMYHDQGQIAIKLWDFESTVTVSAGLPYPIATPSHGTAFDIVGKGVAKTGAMEKAVIICSQMAIRGQHENRRSNCHEPRT